MGGDYGVHDDDDTYDALSGPSLSPPVHGQISPGSNGASRGVLLQMLPRSQVSSMLET